MLALIRPAFVLLFLFTILTGLVYPFVVMGIGKAIFPGQADGSLIVKDGKVVGSELIGQNFTQPKYFHGRPSATTDAPYNASNSSGSNLGPASKALAERIGTDASGLRSQGTGQIPADLVTTSASGLDPHITPEAAYFQVARIAKARGMDEAALRTLIGRHVEPRLFGLLGEPVVNVLKLNLALETSHSGSN